MANYHRNFSLENIVAEINGIVYTEEWRDVTEFPGYQVSSFGRIKRLQRVSKTDGHMIPEAILYQSAGKYISMMYRKDNKTHARYTHRTVCRHFHNNPENKPQVNHKNLDKYDNHESNVEWATLMENRIHADKNGRYPSHYKKLTERI